MKGYSAIVASAIIMSIPASVYAAQAIDDSNKQIEHRIETQQQVDIKNTQPHQTQQSDVQFKLQKIEVTVDDALKVDQSEIDLITKDYLNHEVTINDLNNGVARITRYLRSKGYLAAEAYMPEQDINNGVLKVAVIPGRYGDIRIDNSSRLNTKTVEMLLGGLKPGDVVTSKKLETALYNMNDNFGVQTGGIFSLGDKIGTSDLTVRLIDSKRQSTVLYADNYGSKSSGRYRYGVIGNLYNVDNKGSHLSVSGLISNGNMHNYSLGYEGIFGRSATKVGISYSLSNYQLGGGFRALGAQGDANILSIYGKTPIWRTSKGALSIDYGWDYKRLKDEYKNFKGFEIKKHSSTLHLGVSGYNQDNKGATQYDLTLYTGKVNMDSDYARYLNLYGKTEGNYTKALLNVNRVQYLDKNLELQLRLQAQRANRNLDSSEQMYLGGAYGVRAYPRGEGSGDEGYLTTAELKYHTKVPGLTLSTFFDMGHIKTTKNGNDSDTLKGWGLGVSYNRPDNYFMRLDYARRIGLLKNYSREDKAKSRIWFVVGKVF